MGIHSDININTVINICMDINNDLHINMCIPMNRIAT